MRSTHRSTPLLMCLLIALALATTSPHMDAADPAQADIDWARALPGWVYHFPDDHAAHPAFKTEWWYFTGNVHDDHGKVFGYELTFFRQGVLPPGRLALVSAPGQTLSRFVQSDFKFAHFAITDLAGRRFYCTQRLSRGAYGEAGFGQARERLAWLEDWQLQPLPDGAWRITARADSPAPMSVDLTVQPTKPPISHGTEGVSAKSAGVGNASHYYSFTRLKTSGKLAVGDGPLTEVSGESWFDHEWASNQLAADQVGWDWFCFQFDDHTELMLYAMRKRDGSVDPVSAGTFIDADGHSEHLTREAFEAKSTRTWTSKSSGGRYPLAWKVMVPSHQLEFTVEPALDEQELVLPGITYWEGAIRATGQRAGKPINGHGYMELTGYTGELKGLQQPGATGADLRRTPR